MRLFFAALLMAVGADIMIAATIWYVHSAIDDRRADSDHNLANAAMGEFDAGTACGDSD